LSLKGVLGSDQAGASFLGRDQQKVHVALRPKTAKQQYVFWLEDENPTYPTCVNNLGRALPVN